MSHPPPVSADLPPVPEQPAPGIAHRALIAAAAVQVRRVRERSGPAVGAPGEAAPIGADSIPGYRIIREVHRGAQGVVYQAVQKNTQRHVAIKVLHSGPFAGPTELLRFEREVQMLGQLDHPNVVSIHDRGVAAGCHYLVMDYIRGQALDAYLVSNRPELGEALALFATVCDAVHAAHLRGIIHRDLKPGNIRVDETGRPHILDFGLARSLWSGGDGADGRSRAADSAGAGGAGVAATITGQFIGSIPWASPEQAEGISGRIDIRTDVYSLGVMLYQILADRFPYSVDGPVHEVLDRIISAEPAPPSRIAARLDGAPRIDEDLDTIALRCLAKQPERRYQSAADLAADIRRFLAGEPIDARRDSRAYVLRKQLRRHRVAVAVAASFLFMLVGGLIVSLALWRSAVRHQRAAEENLDAARIAQAAAAENAARAQGEAQRGRRVLDLLTAIFNVTDPRSGGRAGLTAAEALRLGAERAVARLDNDPLAQSDLLVALGNINQNLGEIASAREMLSRALELRREHLTSNDPAIAVAAAHLAQADEAANDLAAAEAHYRVAYDITSARFSRENWHVVQGLVRIASARRDFRKVEEIARASLPQLRQGKGATGMLVQMLNELGHALEEQDRHAEAVPVMREAAALVDGLPPHFEDHRWATRNNLAWVLASTGACDEARRLADEVLAIRRQRLPADHLDIASSMLVLGAAKLKCGDRAGACPLLEESLRIRAAALAATDERINQARLLLDECRRAGP